MNIDGKLERIVRVFHGSLKMMAIRGYDISPFQKIHDEIDNILNAEEQGILIPFTKTLYDLTSFIQLNNQYFYGFNENIIGTSGVENFSYIVTNYKTGYRTMVYFSSIDKNLGSDEFTNIIKTMKKVSLGLTGDDNFCAVGSRVSGILILKNKLGPNPGKKTSAIDNLEHILDHIILSHPYDNVMQSQHYIMNDKEKRDFLNEIGVSPNLLPSMVVEDDTFLSYINAEAGNIVKVYREEYSGQVLDKSIFFRLCK